MKPNKIQLPKDALSRIELGQSFAEYDLVRKQIDLFVKTPALNAALSSGHAKCFFVGRRGTGKTAITYYLSSVNKNAFQLIPQIFDIIQLPGSLADYQDTRQRHFKSLVTSFQRAIIDEIVLKWLEKHNFKFSSRNPILNKERNFIEDYDFDSRLITFIEDTCTALHKSNDKEWLKYIKRSEELLKDINEVNIKHNAESIVLIDRIDESWDGTNKAVILLMALMHACIQIRASTSSIRPLVFIRENIFERVRQIDNEFARLETSVVSLDWTKEQLLELIERRLNLPFNTKLPLGGTTWDYFFECAEGQSSRSLIFDYCQDRPRDVLTYCSFAINSAQSHNHSIVKIEDIQDARRRFSDSRLKDLGDEYSENFPQIQLVINRFYGLGKEYSISGIEAFIKKLLVDNDIRQYCERWIYEFTTPDLFIELLYNIGFVGIKNGQNIQFRSLGSKSSTPPAVTPATIIAIHPSYADALNLQSTIITTLDEALPLQKAGILTDLPEAINFQTYQDRLHSLLDEIKTLPVGREQAAKYEDVVGEVIKLCFYKSLTNVQPRSRTEDGCVVRDWVVSNRASQGFWEMIKQRYQAIQIIWECKNFENLDSGVFQQVSYYMTKEIGYFAVLAFRGTEIKRHYYEHIKRVANEKNGGIILLLNDKDLRVFLRQAINGKIKEEHIYDIYDRTIREIS